MRTSAQSAGIQRGHIARLHLESGGLRGPTIIGVAQRDHFAGCVVDELRIQVVGAGRQQNPFNLRIVILLYLSDLDLTRMDIGKPPCPPWTKIGEHRLTPLNGEEGVHHPRCRSLRQWKIAVVRHVAKAHHLLLLGLKRVRVKPTASSALPLKSKYTLTAVCLTPCCVQ